MGDAMIINRIDLVGEGKRRKESNKNPAAAYPECRKTRGRKVVGK